MKKLFLFIALAMQFAATPALAQSWTVGAQTPVWTATPTIGDGVDRFPEVSTTSQGGDPPALQYEPSVIDENGTYVRSQWLTTPTLPGDRNDSGEAKARFTCAFSHFGTFDPIVYPGQATAGHHHTFIGNEGTNGSSTYTSLRTNPKSSCNGGPLNATAYWEPSLMFELNDTTSVPIKPNVVTFYYKGGTSETFTGGVYQSPSLYRLLHGLAFIGGVDPSDRLNTARLAEIPDGAGWLKTKRYNGWVGWACYNGTTPIALDAGNTADAADAYFARQLENNDGTDPWGGACEGSGYTLLANLVAPACWDGHNLTSPNGRDHFRYPILQSANQTPAGYKCPDGWWTVPSLESKVEFRNAGMGYSGHAWRSKLYISSDRMDPNPANWQPRGSTMHFDWMNGWDSAVMDEWLVNCVGVSVNGTAGSGLTCNDSTISNTNKLKGGSTASPDPTLSNDPILTFHDYANEPNKNGIGPIPDGSVVTITGHH